MKRKTYERPTMKVVQLQQRSCILTGSGTQETQANRSGYGAANTDDWE